MSGMGQLSQLMVRGVPFTPKSDQTGVKVKLKVYWKTTRFWTQADIIDYQQSVPVIAERLRTEEYWNKHGEIKHNKFTCEDFAIRILCEYASSKELPVKLTTGVRTYRNMEMYSSSDHDKYASNKYGFCEMVMKTYGARDMQRVDTNTQSIGSTEELKAGDILAQAKDRRDLIAHHIQVVYIVTNEYINIYQGNSGVGNWTSPLYKIFQFNPADPQDISYTGKPIQIAYYKKENGVWNYKNPKAKREETDFLKFFEMYRWNFMEFNK